jgi:hypothetical protein
MMILCSPCCQAGMQIRTSIHQSAFPPRLKIEAPCGKLQGIFECKEGYHFQIRSHSLQQATGNALAVAFQNQRIFNVT